MFDAYVALDWSGAAGRRYAGIAIAELGANAATPRLIRPRDRLWSRSAAIDWLAARLAGSDRVLAGIDCAFSLPGNTLPAPSLWAEIERAAAGAADFHGAAYAAADGVAPLYWTKGTMPAGWVDRHRATEQACLAQGLGAPQSPYKLIGAKQVGKGALAGMRALLHLKAQLGQRIAVWPFESLAGGSVLVEIYPRLFLRRVGHGSAKVRTRAELDRCLAALGCSRPTFRTGFDDHEADALVSAAGLRLLAGNAQSWKPTADAAILAREGWIFGVS
ncbi:hypothetical protein [Roseiterribacter gracilis]|uniref:DUF429 domain-containing protein n=1 Tax=Roseiterribacter gracilis TaxID=2812848 RepID=A0A8S8X9G9_9PROT|nr:hypothetical protein TMPK1_00330 [Rhodospirillales bacterium TMPK1]